MSGRGTLKLAAAAGAAVLVNRAGEVSETDAAVFQTVRPRLFGIAYRVLGTASEADDVVQETWIRWQGTDRSTVRDAAAFLATTTTRLAINVTQSARARREVHIGLPLVEVVDAAANPSLDAEHSEALESAVGVLLQKLSPAECAAYVLREAFDYSYRTSREPSHSARRMPGDSSPVPAAVCAVSIAGRSVPPSTSDLSTNGLAADAGPEKR
jgi:RNA polymerase sigma-70 factor (ECF subfamily)